MACGDCQRFPDIDNGMGHDDGILTDGKPGVRLTPQESVKPHEHIFPQIRFNDLCAMGRDIKPLKPGVDDVALFLSVGTFSEPCIFKVGPLGDHDIFAHVDFGFDHRETVQRATFRNPFGPFDIDDVKDLLKVFLAAFHEIDEYPLRRETSGKINVIFQTVGGIPVQEAERLGITHPHGSGVDFQMIYLPGLNI